MVNQNLKHEILAKLFSKNAILIKNKQKQCNINHNNSLLSEIKRFFSSKYKRSHYGLLVELPLSSTPVLQAKRHCTVLKSSVGLSRFQGTLRHPQHYSHCTWKMSVLHPSQTRPLHHTPHPAGLCMSQLIL